MFASALVATGILAQDPNVVATTGPVSMVKGEARIQPHGGTAGFGVGFNYLPYELPGEYANANTNTIDGTQFDIAYANRNQPIQTSDWWTGIGLQWSGWVVGRKPEEGQIGRSNSFISEPFHMQFVDVNPTGANVIPGISLPVSGLRLWNQNAISVKTDGKINAGDPVDWSLNFAGRGNLSRQDSPTVTVGLANVQPLGLEPRDTAPFSNVKVESYSDWGVVVSYGGQDGTMQITMANGSPYVWFERTQGAASFTVWTGELDTSGSQNVWYNHDNVIGVTVTSSYIPFNGLPKTTSTASYVIVADTGSWTAQNSTHVSMFQNAAATRVAVLAMPHNIDPADTQGLTAAMNELLPYACGKISGTKLHYPPIPGSDQFVVADGHNLPLGYDSRTATIRTRHEVFVSPFPLAGCPSTAPVLQIVLPHHRKAMIPSSLGQILTSAGSAKYVWNGVIGEMHAYAGSSYVRALRAKGLLPFFPSVSLQAGTSNPVHPDQTASEDMYQELKRWFFVEEPETGNNNVGSVARNLGTYSSVQTNTYMQSLAGLYEPLVIADQLARSAGSDQTEAAQAFGSSIDPDFQRTKADVAGEVRDQLLQMLKELVGQWADVHTAQFFMYNSKFNSTVGYPSGYGSVQNFNDHHFHYGYFLRAAAMIGRYDPAWLQAYMPMIGALRRDVATYDRADTSYPFLREFSPFYGHSWANGTADAGGNDQESTSEAINFAVGLIELGELLGNQEWVELGMYMFEEEVLATEQYWFNQDADLTNSPITLYNGNWPTAFVRFQGPDGTDHLTTLITNTKQFGIFRNTFFGGILGSYTIQATPLSAFTAYLGRNQNWLQATWNQFLKETADQSPGIYQVIVSSLQARLPGTGTEPQSTGLAAALTRINAPHDFFPASSNVMGKHFAYTHSQLGQVDTSVVADTPMYGVFQNGGVRSYSAYNPTSTPFTVNFSSADTGAPIKSFTVPAGALATVTDAVAQPIIDLTTPHQDNPSQLYLRSGATLQPTPGSYLPQSGETPFPLSSADLAATLQTVAVRPDKDNSTPMTPPDESFIQSWKGQFSGALLPAGSAFTRFAIYSSQVLNPGWQQDLTGAANVVTVRFLYDFDSDGKIDRLETLQNVPMFFGNSFLYQCKITEYYFDQIYGDTRGRIPVAVGQLDGSLRAPFPENVANGTVTLEIYGGSSAAPLVPLQVSQDTSPLLNRASWVAPPYVTR
jgi:hypothetical protein